MGYACPVCETPQSDGEHLANHLAFAAILGDDDHESWLDEHAPGWNEDGPDELAPRITEYADEEEYPQVFEDTTHDHDHGHEHGGHGLEEELQQTGGYGRDASMGADAQRIMSEAREMTEEMLDDDGDSGDSDGTDESQDENE